jgi:hypothetical protein
VQDQKDELTARTDERIQKVFAFWVRLDTDRAAVQQSVGLEYRDATEGRAALGAEVSRMLKRLTHEQATMIRLTTWAPARNNKRGREEATTRRRENEGLEAAGADGESTELD